MNLKKYLCYTFVAMLYGACTCNNTYKREEEEGYYTQNHYALGQLESFEKTIDIIESFDKITDFRKKLEDRIPKWRTSGTEEAPDKLWDLFYKKEIVENIIKQLQAEGYNTTLLENYFDKFGHLIKEPTKKNEQALITAIKELQADAKLIKQWKACIGARYNNPAAIIISKEILGYQTFLYFILNDPNNNNSLPITLKKLQSNLEKWKQDGHPTGEALWKIIQEKEIKLLTDSRLYRYTQNQEAIQKSLRLIDQLADDPYSLSYKDLIETLPHGIKQLKDILHEVGLKEEDHIKLLKVYLGLVSSIAY